MSAVKSSPAGRSRTASRRPPRRTIQRAVVAQALGQAGQALSAQELHEQVRERHPMLSLATVYRALEAQVQAGTARRLERPGHVSAYVACEPEHHHHLVCTLCHQVEDLDERSLRPLLGEIQRRRGFHVDHARLDFYGLCARCRATAEPATARRGLIRRQG